MARIDWGGTDRQVRNRMTEYGKRVQAGMLVLGEQWAAVLEAYAKTNRPWTDRTSNAKQSLWSKAFTIPNGKGVMIVLSHGVYYGTFLELSNQGRYAIIMPTLEAHYAPLWSSYKKLVGA